MFLPDSLKFECLAVRPEILFVLYLPYLEQKLIKIPFALIFNSKYKHADIEILSLGNVHSMSL